MVEKIMFVMIKRIVSFLPSGTELVYEFGSQDLLYGVTHECKHPKEAQTKPLVINSVINSEKLSSDEINEKTCQIIKDGKDIFVLQEKNILKANPDLIISQQTCEVCAAYTTQVSKAIKILQKELIVYSMDPHSLEEILSTVLELGKILGKNKKALEIKERFRNRILHVKTNSKKGVKRILAIEWIKPFFTAGHWIPEMIEFAGGTNMISKEREHSRKMNMSEIAESDPDIIILMPCGFDTKRTMVEYERFLRNNSDWNNLKAVKNHKVFAVDANSFFSKPSIRTVVGLEILAKIIQPENFTRLVVPSQTFCNVNEGFKY